MKTLIFKLRHLIAGILVMLCLLLIGCVHVGSFTLAQWPTEFREGMAAWMFILLVGTVIVSWFGEK